VKSRYKEYRLYLLQVSSKLTASSARYLFKILLPKIGDYIRLAGGEIESYSVGKKTYLLIFGSSEMKEIVKTELRFIVKDYDVTHKIVNDHDYMVSDSALKYFDYVKFEYLYRERYLETTPKWFAERRIAYMGVNSRYIDHQVSLNHKKNK
jgi:hypothetical protein